ncbi:uncharacterized protein LOC106156080 [Lingula anatina]|uniref:Uncharacterized protein LOC106156080 n=1 Tax=Lingula anatina TaxID=7574 RepID=A0A1S3HKV1_LINAN|nr:uncharacterized protein LOC106156080 [Lingula anatina]|eukprot:XP_013386652.1 uncharacterized protein LOC106156080 [Lingula anatina]
MSLCSINKWTYARSLLNDINAQGKYKLPSNTWTTIKDLNIIEKLRGSRGGVNHRRVITTIQSNTKENFKNSKQTGPNFDNLLHIKKTAYQVKLKLNCALWNARSIASKVSSLVSCIHEDDWIKSNNDPIISELNSSISGYSLYEECRTGKRGGGVAVLARSNLKMFRREKHSFKSLELLDLAFRSGSEIFRSILVNRPPNKKNLEGGMQNFFTEFSSILETAITASGHLLIAGDFNIHVDNKQSRDALHLSDILLSRNLKQHVHKPTHQKGHTMDLIITRASEENFITSVEVSDSLQSDHSLIRFSVNVSKPPPVKVKPSRRNLKEIIPSVLKAKLFSAFNDHCFDGDVDYLCDYYTHSVESILDEIAPVKTVLASQKPRAPWFCLEHSELRKTVRKAERQWKSSGLEVHHQIFKGKRLEYCRRADDIKSSYH